MNEQLTIGDALRDQGMARVEAASTDDDIAAIDAAIAEANASGREWSANDIRARFDVERHQLVGARVRAAAMRKSMRRVGYVPSDLPSTHSHPIALWIGVAS